jgi:hypothetical protein
MTAYMTSTRGRAAGGARVALCAGALVLLLTVGASGQDKRTLQGENPSPQNPPAQGAPAQDAPPAAPEAGGRKPGLFDAISRWIDDSVSGISAGMKSNQERWGKLGDQAGEAAKGAVDAVSRLPTARVVDGRARCEIAANGAPDCQAAASTICRGKGFKAGQSVNTESAQKCPARVLLLGRRATEAECQRETYVTRAMCQ